MNYTYSSIVKLMVLWLVIIACESKKDKTESKSIHSDQTIKVDLSAFADGIHHWELFATNFAYERLAEDDFESIADNFVKYQNSDGGWPKNMDWLAIIDVDSLKATLKERQNQSTFDNDNTHSQIDFLARMYANTEKESYKESVVKGLNYILETQNASGGWRGWDVDAITYNDNVTNGIMDLLLDIRLREPYYDWLDAALRQQLDSALDRAIETTLNCQIVVDGVRKGWCQQHSHEDFKPVKGRSFELPSVVSRESVEILRFLMRIPNPNEEVIISIESGVQWLEASALYNIRVEDIPIPADTYPGQNLDVDRKVVVDSTAARIWSRFYQIEDNVPFMCRRDSTKVYSLAEVNPERRGGYAWYGYWPEKLLSKDYPKWKERNGL
ncbi:pectate lyase [Reichenbachiella ulvae]|uniref:Pectate lyase n=1 Tax=Reichenbachiella ulvae TaxID=2980104 RepID=A0ABT3CR01_9BACT|nr:pectate lyase [Reichenbachiella ulvae]MCV9386133.1 pectate lyase [Reichenbachiella ulvae]